MEAVKGTFVTKFITKRELDNFYGHNSMYALMEKMKGGYKIGFMIVGDIPQSCARANKFEIKKIEEWRKNHNIL